jgi:hypothetical protein
MSKTFIIILIIIGIGVVVTLFGMNQTRDTFTGYEAALATCGLEPGAPFTEEELLLAQECACRNGDQTSCNFVNLQQ